MNTTERTRVGEELQQAKKDQAKAEAKAAGLFEQLEAAESMVNQRTEEVRIIQKAYDSLWSTAT